MQIWQFSMKFYQNIYWQIRNQTLLFCNIKWNLLKLQDKIYQPQIFIFHKCLF